MAKAKPAITKILPDVEQMKEALTADVTLDEPVPTRDLLGTGSTLLNLAISGRPQGGFARGKYFFLIGDSGSGKTWLVLSALAEAAQRKSFDEYDFFYNNVEDGALMDKTKYFGARMAARIQEIRTPTLEGFYYDLYDRLITRKPCIYILDSMDALMSDEDSDMFEANKKAFEEGKEAKGSYGMGRARTNSRNIRTILPWLRDTGSILFVICQTRDNIDPRSYETKTRAGGRALKFYATVEMWTSIAGRIKKTFRDNDLQIGINTKVKITKNRISGKEWTTEFPIYFSHGIDDTGSCVDFLLEWKHWKKAGSGTKITAPEFEFEGTKDRLIKYIEDNDLERDLRNIVAEVWAEIEEATTIQRKARYE